MFFSIFIRRTRIGQTGGVYNDVPEFKGTFAHEAGEKTAYVVIYGNRISKSDISYRAILRDEKFGEGFYLATRVKDALEQFVNYNKLSKYDLEEKVDNLIGLVVEVDCGTALHWENPSTFKFPDTLEEYGCESVIDDMHNVIVVYSSEKIKVKDFYFITHKDIEGF